MKALKRLRRKIKYNRKVNSIVMFFFVLFLFMGVGYAYLNATLSITGTGKVTKTTWDVHFENVQEEFGSVTPTSAPVISNDTSVSFSATLPEPGTYYGFTVDLVNAGTIDATIDSFDISPTLTPEQQEYFEYIIQYADGRSIQEGDSLCHGVTKSIVVLFRYKELANHDLYPDEDVNFNFTITINVIQGSYDKEGSVLKPTYQYDTSDFRESDYVWNIASIIFDDRINPPDNYIESWDVSEAHNGNVMAYIKTNSQDNTKYDLYIQGNGYLYAPENSSYLFSNMESLVEIVNLHLLDTSHVTDMSYMFRWTSKMNALDLSSFDTSNVVSMRGMFETIDDVPRNLRFINGLGSFDTSKVTDMSYMFHNQILLSSLFLSIFETGNVTNMEGMFNGCSGLTLIYLNSFDTSKVTNMEGMFSGCSLLQNLDLSSFNTSSVTNMKNMFSGANSLRTIYVSNSFVTDNVSYANSVDMFSSCTSIVGGNGTTYNSNIIDKTYARIDDVGIPGYFYDGEVG